MHCTFSCVVCELQFYPYTMKKYQIRERPTIRTDLSGWVGFRKSGVLLSNEEKNMCTQKYCFYSCFGLKDIIIIFKDTYTSVSHLSSRSSGYVSWHWGHFLFSVIFNSLKHNVHTTWLHGNLTGCWAGSAQKEQSPELNTQVVKMKMLQDMMTYC